MLMLRLIDAVLYLFLYILIGLLFTKTYKIFFPYSYNFLNWAWDVPEEDSKKDYDKNRKYPEPAYFVAIFIFPFIALWLIISRPVLLFIKLIKFWLDINNKNKEEM